ncbi:Nif3-like dinuclear metal center hexameric protein [Oceanospirillum sediminis]|uniref:GTP cyclohydrolase 1 type 2 homolog n=1 Tax=Oceanospirillum sediminis TaxID=2760088 RepID=A0A839IJJ0_9GAMM|nr:Nif3-like dinuclear metal center hexameric protein [Oceanospirillum sediminis]MBB1485503.1 Nif3-like dinuclear metal center hexameric protein [Oceanospirillum sediminis]
MSITLTQLIQHLDTLLEPQMFKDYCPNGLQVQGRNEVSVVATAVTASQNMVDQAAEAGADVLLVHHGYFWRNEPQVLTGMKYHRISQLIRNDISLLAYHLPLDAHPELGNNARLAAMLSWKISGGLEPGNSRSIGLTGAPLKSSRVSDIALEITNKLKREPLVIGDKDRVVKKLAWCSGAAQGMIELAAEAGCDLFVSGEISENTVHAARELGITYIAAGHHATERYGVLALGEWLQRETGIRHIALDEENPV